MMNKKLTWVVLSIVFAFTLTMFAGCAEKKAVVKESAAQDQQVVSDQAVKETASTTKEIAKEEVSKVAVAVTEDVIKDIYFDYDKSNIRPDAREVLKVNADYFLKNSPAAVIVEGHCDERGTAEYNMALGQRRAEEAKKYLVNLGVKESKIKTISYGKERPVDQGHNEEAWAKNRRDHFVVNIK